MATTSKAALSSDSSSNGGTAYIATQSTLVAVATLLVLIRVFVRAIVIKHFGIDDAIILLALPNVLFTKIHRKLMEVRFSLSSSVR